MKIIIITQNEPFFIPKLLKKIIYEYKEHIELIVLLNPEEYKNKFKAFWYYLRFWGSFQFLKIGLKFINMKFSNKLGFQEVKTIQETDINNKKFINKAKNVDYIISIASNQIFKSELLNAPKKMCLNIHAALLPNYRGFNPSFWVLYNDEKYTGVTLHKMSDNLDQGAVIEQEKINIEKNETWFSLQNKVVNVGIDVLKSIFPRLTNNNLEFKKINGKGSYYSKPCIKKGKEFRKRGKRFI